MLLNFTQGAMSENGLNFLKLILTRIWSLMLQTENLDGFQDLINWYHQTKTRTVDVIFCSSTSELISNNIKQDFTLSNQTRLLLPTHRKPQYSLQYRTVSRAIIGTCYNPALNMQHVVYRFVIVQLRSRLYWTVHTWSPLTTSGTKPSSARTSYYIARVHAVRIM